MERNLDKIDWFNLSKNKAAIRILKAHQNKIHWYSIWQNPAIFEMDYAAMREKMRPLAEELARVVYFHGRA